MNTRLLPVIATALAVAMLPACSSSAPSTAETSTAGELAEVSVALVPVTGSAPIFVAAEQGFFEDEGLDVTIQEVPGPAAVAALQNGEVEFASLGASVVVGAVAQGLPLQVVSSLAHAPQEAEEESTVLMVMPDSGLEDVSSLDGASVATQSLSSQATIMTRAAIDNLGGDSSTVEFIDVPFPDQMSALRSGAVDAAAAVEPFVTAMLDEGAVPLIDISRNAFDVPGPIGVVASLQQTVAEDPDTVAAFSRAYLSAVKWILEDEARFRAALPELVGLTPDQAERMVLPVFREENVTEQGMQALVDLMIGYELIEQEPDMTLLVP